MPEFILKVTASSVHIYIKRSKAPLPSKHLHLRRYMAIVSTWHWIDHYLGSPGEHFSFFIYLLWRFCLLIDDCSILPWARFCDLFYCRWRFYSAVITQPASIHFDGRWYRVSFQAKTMRIDWRVRHYTALIYAAMFIDAIMLSLIAPFLALRYFEAGPPFLSQSQCFVKYGKMLETLLADIKMTFCRPRMITRLILLAHFMVMLQNSLPARFRSFTWLLHYLIELAMSLPKLFPRHSLTLLRHCTAKLVGELLRKLNIFSTIILLIFSLFISAI